MKGALLLIVLFTTPHCFSQNSNALSWYKMLSGKIDKTMITMHLHKSGHSYSGYYYYDAQQEPIYFTGDDTTVKGKVQLVVYANANDAEYFLLTSVTDKITGNWKRSEKASPLIFTATEIKIPLGFTYVFTNGAVKLRPKLKDSPEATYEAASVWPYGNTGLDSFIKKMIRKDFGEERAADDIGKILLKQKGNYFKGYLDDFKNDSDKDIKESPIGYGYETSSKLMIFFQSARILTLAHFNFDYTGGAHGMYGTSYTSIDLANKKEIQLKEVITSDGMKKLGALLEKNFRRQYKLKPNESLTEGGLFEEHIKPNENFYLTGKGIGFNYLPYEIGPYSSGEITIFIPFKDLEAYLQPGFKKLIS